MAAQLPTLAGGKDSLLKFTGDKLSTVLGPDAWKHALFDDTPIMNAAFDLVGGFGSMMMKSIFGSDENTPGAAPVTQQSGPTAGAGENAEVNQELDVQTDIMQETLGVTYNILKEVSGNRFEEIERERERLRRERIKGQQPASLTPKALGSHDDKGGLGMVGFGTFIGLIYAMVSGFLKESLAQLPKWSKIPDVMGRYGTEMPGRDKTRIGMTRALAPNFMGHVDTYTRWVKQNNAYWKEFSRVFHAPGRGLAFRGSVQPRDMVKMLNDWPRIQSRYIKSADRIMATLEAFRKFGSEGIGPNSKLWKWTIRLPKTLNELFGAVEGAGTQASRQLVRIRDATRELGAVGARSGEARPLFAAIGQIGDAVRSVIQTILRPFSQIYGALDSLRKGFAGIGKWIAKTLGFAVKKILLPFFMIKDALEEFTRSGNFANAILESGRTFIEFWYGALVDLISDGIFWVTKQAMKLFGAGPETLKFMDQLIEFDFAKFIGEVTGQIWASLYNTIAQGLNAIVGMFSLGTKTDLVPYVNPETGMFAGENEAPIRGEGWLGAPKIGHGYGEKEISRAFPQWERPKPTTIGTLDPGAAGGNIIVLGGGGQGESRTPVAALANKSSGSIPKNVRDGWRSKQVDDAIGGEPGYSSFRGTYKD